MDLVYLLACLLISKQASVAALQYQNSLKRNNCQPYAALKGDSTLGQEQLPLRRPSGRFYTWTRTATLMPPLRAVHLDENSYPYAALKGTTCGCISPGARSIRTPQTSHPLSEFSASTFAGFVQFDLFAYFRQPRLRPSAR